MTTKTSLLIVEDSLSLAAIYKGYLDSEHVDVHHVATLSDAAVYLERSVPDIVLLDIELPDGNGMDLLRGLVKQKNNRYNK